MKRKRKKSVDKTKSRSRGSEPSYVTVTVFLALIFSAGFIAKTVFSPGQVPANQSGIVQTTSPLETPTRLAGSIEGKVRQVAANFKCACEGCGELPLVDCSCDMPRGAREEKRFIRDKLREGFTVDQVVELVDQKYGFRTT